MQKTKKQILGIAGLLAVGAMTAIAFSLPAPDAAAVTEPSSSGNVDINVMIYEGDTAVTLLSPLDGNTFVDANIEVSTRYEVTSQLEYYLTYTDDEGQSQTKMIKNVMVDAAEPGVDTFNLDLSEYGYREFNLRVVAVGPGSQRREDSATFYYNAIAADFNQGTATNGDPILQITANDSVDKVRVQVYDANGRPLFVNANGEEVPVWLNRNDIDPETGKITTTLPFEQYGAESGTYTAVITAYSDDGGESVIVGMVTLDVNYKPLTPETPNTGLLSGTGISRVDYIVTGLIAFGLIAGFAIYLVSRKQRR